MRKLGVERCRAIALASAVIASCTRLEDPNDTFGAPDAGGTGGTSGASPDGGQRAASRDAGADGHSQGSTGVHPDGAASGSGRGSDASAADASGVGGTSGAGGATTVSGGVSSDAGGADAGCIDPSGFHGLGCYRCSPTDVVTLEAACTTATCTPFAGMARLTKLGVSGELPPLPAPSSGTGGAASTGGATSTGGAAGTGLACADLASRGQVVYVTGSSASKPFLQQIAQQVAGQNVFLVFTSTGSCVGVDAIVNGTPMTTGPSPAPALSATYWDGSSSPGVACDLPAGGVAADLGISDVFAQSCTGFELVSLDALQIRDSHGPIQTMTFVVPTSSPFTEISVQAAYFVFGFGAAGGVLSGDGATPIWNDEAYLFKRSATSGTQAMLAAAIGVPAPLWKGKASKTSDEVAASIQGAGGSLDTAAKAIGILAADYIDTRNLRAQVRVLALQDTEQPCAVYPDSSATARDKRNVRDGHYPVWGPLHLLHRVDQLGNPLNPATRQAVGDIVGYLSGTKALPNGVKLIDVYAQSGLVPECAMRVTRTKDGGNILPKVPDVPCACLFESKATGATACTPCVVQGDCGAGETCSLGYCEK
jgi:hypothetical protein